MSQPSDSPPISPLKSSDEESSYTLFSPRQRAVILTIVCIADAIGPLSSLMYTPALPAIAESLGVSISKINLVCLILEGTYNIQTYSLQTITTYLIFQGVTPSIWGAIADVYGRRSRHFFRGA